MIAAAIGCMTVLGAQASIIGLSIGTAAPPPTLGSWPVVPFGLDVQPPSWFVTSVATPGGGSIVFDAPMYHVTIGGGWATWSNGYTGDVYINDPADGTAQVTLPANTRAFYLYAEPNTYDNFTITATSDSGTLVSQLVNGLGGAMGYGFYTDASDSIASITINSDDASFAIGEFGIAEDTNSVPEPSQIASGLLLLAGVAGYTIRRRRAAK